MAYRIQGEVRWLCTERNVRTDFTITKVSVKVLQQFINDQWRTVPEIKVELTEFEEQNK